MSSVFWVSGSLRLRSVNGFNDSINQLFNDSTIQQGYLLSYILRTNDLPFFQGEYPKGEGFLAPSPGVEVWGRAKQRGFFLLPDASTKSGDWRQLTVDLTTIIKIYLQNVAVVKYVIYLWAIK